MTDKEYQKENEEFTSSNETSESTSSQKDPAVLDKADLIKLLLNTLSIPAEGQEVYEFNQVQAATMAGMSEMAANRYIKTQFFAIMGQYKLYSSDEKGNRRYSVRSIRFLQTVKALKESCNMSYNDIRNAINNNGVPITEMGQRDVNAIMYDVANKFYELGRTEERNEMMKVFETHWGTLQQQLQQWAQQTQEKTQQIVQQVAEQAVQQTQQLMLEKGFIPGDHYTAITDQLKDSKEQLLAYEQKIETMKQLEAEHQKEIEQQKEVLERIEEIERRNKSLEEEAKKANQKAQEIAEELEKARLASKGFLGWLSRTFGKQ